LGARKEPGEFRIISLREGGKSKQLERKPGHAYFLAPKGSDQNPERKVKFEGGKKTYDEGE